MRQSTIRRVVAGGVVVALITLGAAALLSTRTSAEPVWAGPVLSTERGTSTEYAIEPVDLPNPERIAAAVLGNPNPSFETSKQGQQTVYRDAGLTVRVRDVSPVTLVGQRGSGSGVLPSEAAALAMANDLLKAFGLDADDWTVTQPSATSLFRSVLYRVKAELPVFTTANVQEPSVSVALDNRGVQSFSATLARLTPRQVSIRSEREAFEKVDRSGRYVSVRLVLVDRGKGRISPHWEFEDEAGTKQPVEARVD